VLGYDLLHGLLDMLDRIRETSLVQPTRDKNNSGFASRIGRIIGQDIHPVHWLQHVLRVAVGCRHFCVSPPETTVQIDPREWVLDREKIHNYYLWALRLC